MDNNAWNGREGISMLVVRELMKIHLSRALIFSFALLAGCSQGQVYSTSKMNFSSVNPGSVLIFRSTYPEWNYEEIGTVIVKDVYDLNDVYDKMRAEAGKRGANAVVDLVIASKEEKIPVDSTSCVGNICSTTTKYQTLFVHTVTGSLVVMVEK